MDSTEIAKEMLNFLNENGQYQNFIKWADARGFDTEDLENDIENELENN